jgi:RNA polymerase sigma-70 factor (ECF subfamily)
MDEKRRRFERLWEEHHDAVLAYARRRTSPGHADDVVDEVFLVVWRRLPEVPPDALPWVLGVARRVIANHRRSLTRGQALISKLTGLPVAVAPDPAETAGGTSLLRALARLSPRDRETLALVAWEGLEPRRAAAAAGCTAATFAVRLHRARKRLLATMQEIEDAGQKPDEEPVPPTPPPIEDAP